MVRLLAAPATSRNVPKFDVFVTVTRVAVPVTFSVPIARGVPAVGRTRTFCQVSEQVIPLWLLLATVKVSCDCDTEVIAMAVPLLAPLMLLAWEPLPFSLAITTVGAVPPVSKTKPLGAFRMIVPVPTSPVAFSVYFGPVKVVNVPVDVSAEIAPPPEAAVYWAAAPTVMVLVLGVLLPSVTSLAITLCVPPLPNVKPKTCVPATSAALDGKVAAASLDVML